MQDYSWGQNFIRMLFASINYCIYSLIEFIMQGIFDIANLRLTDGLIGDIYKRIYAFLAIFMVFKLTISFLKYMVNPDSIVDKEKGAGKLISRTVTMLALILMLPMLFPLLNEAQEVFLPILPKVILGQSVDNADTVEDNARLLASTALVAFYRPCEGCDDADKPPEIKASDDAVEIMMDTYNDHANGYYLYNFNYLTAAAAGIIIVIILLAMTIKMGIRIFKMFILEMIAPIPVMSYIDPKSSKDGAFASWVKQLTSTFLDIFVRLGIIYVVLMLLSALANDNLLDVETLPDGGARRAYLMVFLIIALLMFAKDAPNFVKDALGIKHDKDTSGVLAGLTAGVLGAGTGAVSGAISGKGIRGALTGAATGLNAGFQGGMAGKKASAWRAGGDAAKQARTGDEKARSGVLNAIQSSASKAQLAREGRKLNLTDETISAAKDNMINMQGLAAEAQRNWDYGVQTGQFRDLQGNLLVDDANGTAMEKAAKIVSDTSTASTIATKNYEKANKAGDAYKISRSFAQDYKKDKKDSKPDYKRGTITKSQYKAKGQFNPNKGKIDR